MDTSGLFCNLLLLGYLLFLGYGCKLDYGTPRPGTPHPSLCPRPSSMTRSRAVTKLARPKAQPSHKLGQPPHSPAETGNLQGGGVGGGGGEVGESGEVGVGGRWEHCLVNPPTTDSVLDTKNAPYLFTCYPSPNQGHHFRLLRGGGGGVHVPRSDSKTLH